MYIRHAHRTSKVSIIVMVLSAGLNHAMISVTVTVTITLSVMVAAVIKRA